MMTDTKESKKKYGDNEEGGEKKGKLKSIFKGSSHIFEFSSIFVESAGEYPHAPSYIGGGFNFESVEAPFNFDRGSIIHLDNNSKFYSMKKAREYETLEEEYKSELAVGTSGDLAQIIQEYWVKHPYLLHTTFDVHLRRLVKDRCAD